MPYKEGKGYRGTVTYQGERYTKLKETRKAALEWENDKRKELKKESLIPTVSLLKASTEYLAYCEQQRYARSTFTDKKKALKELMKLTGNIAIDHITPADILSGIILMQPTPNLANKRRKDLRSFFEHCRNFHDLAHNPIMHIDKIPQERKPQPVPTDVEYAKLLLKTGDRQDRNMLIAFANSGARRSELFRIKFSEDVDFSERLLRLGSRKNKARELRYREIPMNQALYNTLQDQFKRRLPSSDYVFQNRAIWEDKEGRITRRHPNYGDRFTARRRYMAGLCKAAKVKPMGFHAMRRYFASKLIENGEDLETIRHLMGHKSASTTDRYIYRLKSDLRVIRAAVDRISNQKYTPAYTNKKGVKP